jgi:hypothetical protein
MYCDVVVTALVVPPTSVCCEIGMRSPTLIVERWLSSAATCGLATILVLLAVPSSDSAAWMPPGNMPDSR